jgi:hypothetical protein
MKRTTTVATFGGVKEREFTLIEQGEYVLTLFELEESEGRFGERMVWKFLVAPREDPTNYIARDDGQEKTVWVFTDRDIILGSFCQELVEILSGRKFEKDGEPPHEEELLSKRCIGYITHETPTRGKNAGKKREKIVEGSLKPFRLPTDKPRHNAPKPTQVSADPDIADVDRALVVTKLQKQVAKLTKLNAEAGAAAQAGLDASDLDTAPLADLERLLTDVTNAVTSALDD